MAAFVAVVALTGAIVAVAFTAVGGDADEGPTSKFMPVGEAIDPGTSGFEDPDAGGSFSTIPMDEEDESALISNGLFTAIPSDANLEDLVDITDRRVILEQEETIEAGPVNAFCTEVAPDSLGGAMRTWSGAGGAAEVDVRIHDMGSVAEAQRAVESRQNDEFIACIPDEVAPASGSGPTFVGAEVTDSTTTATGDQLEQILLLDDGEEGALLAWRQVGKYVVSVKIFDYDFDGGADLDLTSADDVLAHVTDALS